MKLCFSSVLSPLVMAICMAGNLAAIEKPEPLYKTIQCTKEELMTFFPQVVVKAVLEKAKIPDDKAEGIADEMSHKDDELMKMVESKASKLDPNPLRDLGQRDVAIKIYRESLLQEFLKSYKTTALPMKSKCRPYWMKSKGPKASFSLSASAGSIQNQISLNLGVRRLVADTSL